MFIPSDLIAKANQYANARQIALHRVMGAGKDGTVWRTSRPSALKIHTLEESYRIERNAYMRFADLNVTDVAGFSIPTMSDHDDDLWAIEMSIVMPPYLLDFASAVFDIEPDFIEDEGHTFEDFIRARFDARADAVMDLYFELAARTGIYLTDLHSQNLKFSNGD